VGTERLPPCTLVHVIEAVRYRKLCAAELAKAQRKMSRRRRPKGFPTSRGYRDAKRVAAKLHKKAARQNVHAFRQWAKSIVDNHALIAVEDFKPKFLATSTMARKAADAAIGAAKRELIERGMRAGRKVVLVPSAYTTMTCSECTARPRRVSGWVCELSDATSADTPPDATATLPGRSWPRLSVTVLVLTT
jgi:putative transposase